jgi:hypothetical protein
VEYNAGQVGSFAVRHDPVGTVIIKPRYREGVNIKVAGTAGRSDDRQDR